MPNSYSVFQVILHWLVAVLIAVQFLSAEGMEHAFEGADDASEIGAFDDQDDDGEYAEEASVSPTLTSGALLHIGLGASIFLLALLRLAVRLRRGAPGAPESDPEWQKRLSRAAHAVLYGLLLVLPVAGAVAWFGGLESAAEFHEVLGTVLLVVVAVHIAGALFGQFVQRTGVLDRMLRPGRADGSQA